MQHKIFTMHNHTCRTPACNLCFKTLFVNFSTLPSTTCIGAAPSGKLAATSETPDLTIMWSSLRHLPHSVCCRASSKQDLFVCLFVDLRHGCTVVWSGHVLPHLPSRLAGQQLPVPHTSQPTSGNLARKKSSMFAINGIYTHGLSKPLDHNRCSDKVLTYCCTMYAQAVS